MIIEQTQRETILEGEILDTHEMSISEAAIPHLIKTLTENSYKKPFESSFREALSNALDSHLEAGNKEPIIVRAVRDQTGNYVLEIEDFGLGLDNKGFDKYIMGIGESSKQNNPLLLGGLNNHAHISL